MSGGALLFWLVSWGFVLGLAGFCFFRLLTHRGHHDPDGSGPELPKEN